MLEGLLNIALPAYKSVIMKKYIIFLFSMLVWRAIKAQTNADTAVLKGLLYGVYQNPNTEDTLKHLIEKFTGVEGKNNRVFIFHLKPGICPRCEGLINQTIKYLKMLDNDCKTIMVLNCTSVKEANAYYKKRNFICDVMFADTVEVLLNKVFNHSNGSNLNVPFVYNIDANTGKMTSYLPFLGITLDKNLVANFYHNKLLLKYSEKSANKSDKILTDFLPNKIIFQDSLSICSTYTQIINDGSDTNLSEPLCFYVNAKQEKCSFIDRLSKSVIVYDWNTKLSYSKIKPTFIEYSIFTNKQEVSYRNLVSYIQDDIVNVMYLSILDLNDSSVTITASLPQLKIKNNDTNDIVYSNVFSFIHKTFNNHISKIDTLKRYADENKYYIFHSKTKKIGDKLFVPLERGWPSFGTDDSRLAEDNFNENPFNNKFYKTRSLYAVYGGQKNEEVKTIGSFDSVFVMAKSGYAQIQQQIASCPAGYLITDGYSGKVQIINKNSFACVREIKLFDIGLRKKDYQKISKITITLKNATDKMEYLKSLNVIFNLGIKDMVVANDCLYAVIKDDFNGKYYLISHNFKTDAQQNILLKYNINAKSLFFIKLSEVSGKVVIYSLFKVGGKYCFSSDPLNL
jgi:hypothetical protein